MFMKLSILLSLLAVNVAYADCADWNCTNVQITRMYVTANGNTMVGTSGDESQLSCDAGGAGYIFLSPTASNYDSTYALLLTAHTTEHPVWIRTSKIGACEVMYVVSDK